MKLYCISDLHLGDGSPKDDFQESIWLMNLCDKVLNQEDAELIIIGDIFEGWQCRFEDILVAHREVITQLMLLNLDHKLILISGNHDLELREIIGSLFAACVFDTYCLHSILFMHGHQFDPMCSRYKWIGHTVSWFGGVLEYIVNRDVDKWFEKLAQRIMGKGRHGDEKEYAEIALKSIADTKDINTIVLGHTHYLCREYKIDDKIYRNSGTAMERNLLIMEV